MKRTKLFLFLLAAILYALTLVGAPAPAHACLYICSDPITYCYNGRIWAQSTCTGEWACVSICAY